MTPRSVERSAVGMGAAAAVSRGFGALRVLVIAAVLGTTYLGNVFQGSNQFSTVIFELLAAGALSAVLVPGFVELLDRGEERGAERVAGGVLGVALVAMAAVSVVGVAIAPQLAWLLASEVDDPEVAAQQQELATFLLRFFIPQVLLYAVGAVSTAVLHARRVFVLPAAAPIANTVVMVALLLVFRSVAGSDPGLDLTTGEQLLLAAAGTLGVAAFVAVPTLALRSSGFRFGLHVRGLEPGARRLLRMGGWATLQHSSAAILLGAAIVVGGGVEGGVVAFQVGWFFFLGPYGVIAQPIQTALLPELVADRSTGDEEGFAASVGWSLDAMGVLLLPISAAFVALAGPLADLIAFGEARSGDGVELIAAALASLGLGLLPYGAYLMLARAWYARGDSRTPALVASATAVLGVLFMVGVASSADGTGLVAGLGLGHGLAFALAALVLAVGLRRDVGCSIWPRHLLAAAALSVAVGFGMWAVFESLAPEGRVASAITLTMTLALFGLAYLGIARALGMLEGRPVDLVRGRR